MRALEHASGSDSEDGDGDSSRMALARGQLAHLDLLFCSSEDEAFPARNLQTRFPLAQHHATQRLQQHHEVLHSGWESEKFCEYPQELVFRVNRGLATRIGHLHILSHHAKVATRIEIFTATAPSPPNVNVLARDLRALIPFQRLGFVSFMSSDATDTASRELKVVPLPMHEKITLVRLVLHRCHVSDQHNLYQQVGLLAVVATEPPPPPQVLPRKVLASSASWSPTKAATSVLPSLHQSADRRVLDSCGEGSATGEHLFSPTLSPLRTKYAVAPLRLNGGLSSIKFGSAPALVPVARGAADPLSHEFARRDDANASAASEYEVWIPELEAFETPLQIAAHARVCYERALQQQRDHMFTSSSSSSPSWLSTATSTALVESWRVLHFECRYLSSKLEMLQRTFDDTSHMITAVHDRAAMHEEIDLVLQEFGALGSRVFAHGASNWTTATAHPFSESSAAAREAQHGPERAVSLFQILPELQHGLHSANWQEREDVVWQAVEYVRAEPPLRHRICLDEAFAVAKAVLLDPHAQVFVAACSLLHQVLCRSSSSSHEDVEATAAAAVAAAPSKSDLVDILDKLLQRLDDQQAVIRNNAAFSMLKVAELTRASGTFVMHFVLTKFEREPRTVSDHVLHALLKLFSALLLAFHCCASIDIAPRRLVRFLAKCDAEMHANPHIRDAAKQLTLVLHSEVGADVLRPYLQRLPTEVQERYEQQFRVRDERGMRAEAAATSAAQAVAGAVDGVNR